MGVTLEDLDDDIRMVESMLDNCELEVEVDEEEDDEKVLVQVPVLFTVMLEQLPRLTTFQLETVVRQLARSMRHLFLNRRHLRVELQRPQTLELAEQLVVVVRHREDGVELLLEEELLLPLPMMITDLRRVVARPLAIPARALILLRVCRDVTVAKVLAFVLF